MNIDDAVNFAKRPIEKHTKKPLNDSQMAVLRGSLEGKSYPAIAKEGNFSSEYAKEIGSELWIALSTELGRKVTKNNLLTVIQQHLPIEKQQISNSEISPKCNEGSRDFVGRDAAITDINNFVNEGTKIIVIQAAGGVGKTTLAKQYLYKNFDLVLPLEMAKETENIISVESEIETWLKQYFQEEPGRDFKTTLNRLKQQLQNRRVGVLIDNLEPALDKQGRLIEKHSLYVELLRVLADEKVQSLTLITSRERFCDDRIDRSIYHYHLAVLTVEAWEEFFRTRKIKIDNPSLAAIHRIYGGNAKAMDILFGVIREDYDGDMAAYWLENSTCVETELKNLVESQFNRLQTLDTEAYKLLFRLGCFRYQDVPRVSIDALLALLWDVPQEKQRDVIKALKNRCLVEFEKGEYWLHPVVREQGIERLKTSGEWEEVNRKAAEFWNESIKIVETIEDARKAFEAYYHYLSINDFNSAAGVIVKGRDSKWVKPGEWLGVSFYRLGLLKQLLSAIIRVIDKIAPSRTKSRLYSALGDVCWRLGKINSAIDYHKQSGNMETELNLFMESMFSRQNMAICYVDLLEIDKAMQLFKEVIYLAQNTEENRCAVFAVTYINYFNSCSIKKDKNQVFDFTENTFNQLPMTNFTTQQRGYTYLLLGMTYKNLGRFEKSFEMYNQAISFAEDSNYIQVKGKALTGLAELYRIQNDFEKALSHHSESIEILDKIGAKCDLAEAYYQLGLTYQKMGETENSNTNFNEAIRLYQEMEAPKQVEKVEKAKTGNMS